MTQYELGASFRIGQHDLRIVESLRVEHRESAGLWFSAAREPVAVLVRERGTTRAYGIDGEPVSLESLRQRLPRASWKAAGIES